MKKVIFAICVLGLMAYTPLSAQKMGHVNSQEILFAMPATKAMQGQLEKMKAEYDAALESMVTEYEALEQDLVQNGGNLQKAIYETKLADLQSKGMRIQEFEYKAQEELMNKKDELTVPIIDQAKKAIQDVAKEKGYTYVFDTSTGALIHYPPSDDITALVKTKLGI
ncbi:MAG: OmpH family outer membrane protein [Chitinophagales bacterium]|nr:OmpH family outer membrane protein [Chitinophagales bacterium]